jgi:hypothetical protein
VPLPDRADAAAVCAMDCTRLRALDWCTQGPEAVDDVLRALDRPAGGRLNDNRWDRSLRGG